MEKKIKRLFSMFFMLFMAGCMVCLTSCKKDGDESGDANHDPRLIGTWVWSSSDPLYNETITETFTFKGDGTGAYELVESSQYGTDADRATFDWKTKDNKVISGTINFVRHNGKTESMNYSADYSISGNKVTINLDGKNQTFTKK